MPFSLDEKKARCAAERILLEVVEPEVRKAKEKGENWIGTSATCWKQGTSSSLKVEYCDHGQALSTDRVFRMKAEVQVKDNGRTLTVSLKCSAVGGRRRDAARKEMVPIPSVDDGVQELPLSVPITDPQDMDRNRKWLQEHLDTFANKCRAVEPNKWVKCKASSNPSFFLPKFTRVKRYFVVTC